MSVDDLLAEQKANAETINNFIRNFKKCSKANLTMGYLKARVEGLGRLWEDYEKVHKQLVGSASDAELKTLPYFINDEYATFEEKYYDTYGKIYDNLNYSTSSTSKVVQSHHEVHLPTISLPTFSGQYSEWQAFHDMFVALVENNSSITAVQKLHYLRRAVSGEAEQLLRSYAIAEPNYASAWKALCKRYNNRRLLINAQLSTLFNSTPISRESASLIRNLFDSTNECLAALTSLDIRVSDWDLVIIHVQIQRLPTETRQEWERKLSVTTEPPTLKSYLDFLESRFRMLEAVDTSTNKIAKRNVSANHTTAIQHVSDCSYCKEQHSIRKCSQFIALSRDAKLQHIKNNHLCFNCLGSEHGSKTCESKRGCFHCGRRHHSLLHNHKTPTRSHRSSDTANISSYHTSSQSKRNTVLLSTALLKGKGNGSEQILRALIDTGSQASFMTTSTMQRLRLVPGSIHATISGVGYTSPGSTHKVAHFEISSRFDGSYTIPVEAIVLPSLTDRVPQKTLSPKLCPHLSALNLADPSFHQPGRIDIILGADIYPYIIREGIKIGEVNTPIAQNTMFGWILLGPAQPDPPTTSIHTFFNKLDLDQELRRFWEMEEVDPPVHISEDDAKCEEHFRNTHTRDADGRYIVALPFRSPKENLGSSYHRAILQLNSLHQKLDKHPKLKTAYHQGFQELLDRGYMEKIGGDLDDVQHYYFPHHGVVKPSSATTKLRIVFNASSKTSTGKSLNDLLYTGPSLQQDIASVITRWRMARIAATADMEKMFLQIRVTDEDTNFQRLVWRENLNSPVEHHRLRTVTFGVASAPFLAMRTIQQIVIDDGKDFEMASVVLREQLYVDNILFGADDIDEILETQRQLISLLEGGGFRLRQWASNNVDVLSRVPEVDVLCSPTVNISNDQPSVSTLGLLWNPTDDNLQLRVQNLHNLKANSKRSVLSGVSKLFDPLGWFAPIIIVGKILMKQLWLLNLDWDESLPPQEQHQWNQFHSSLRNLELIKLPRWIHTTRKCSLQLHGFCDSSQNAYAAVIYLRVQHAGDETPKTSILMAKTKVAPVKTISLPRLELCGATLLTALVRRIQRDLSLTEVPLYCWSDSTIVLAWLRQQPCHWKTFVANRVSTIRDGIPTARWCYVPSKENPADVATRGSTSDRLRDDTTWWNGPHWLVYPTDNWPKQRNHFTKEEMKRVVTITTHTTVNEPIIALTNYSSYSRLIRVTAYCFRFINNSRNERSNRQVAHLQIDELNHALDYWIRSEQSNYLGEEIQRLKTNVPSQSKRSMKKATKRAIRRANGKISERPNRTNNKVKALTPFLDKTQTLRVGGRLRHADLPYDQRHPILLPYNSHLSKLIVAHCHITTLHGGTNATIACIRRKFWILKIRSLVKIHIHRCIRCFRQQKVTAEQLMGDLPKPRITPARPFLTTGIDYAGPISLRASNLRNSKILKGYFAIFVCLCTKAIHLEVVSDLTTEAFLAALRRFIARRGLCKDIYSDCGTNFVGADATLRKSYKEVINAANHDVSEILANDGINWHFIPPASPHFGGLWEAGVRSVKHHLRRVLGDKILTFEEMTTLLTQIEACLNSRPLCPMSDDPNDLASLTPGHFLIGTALTSPPEQDYSQVKYTSLKRWAFLQKMRQDFWIRWKTEYLSRLQQRPKWLNVEENPKTNQLVVIKDERLPPLKWMMGRIINTFSGADGLVRVVELKTQTSIIRRPIQKICILPTEDIWSEKAQSSDHITIQPVTCQNSDPNSTTDHQSLAAPAIE